jgi:hypothetical protein
MRRILSAKEQYVNKIPIIFVGIKQILQYSSEKRPSLAGQSLSLAPFGLDSTPPRLIARA